MRDLHSETEQQQQHKRERSGQRAVGGGGAVVASGLLVAAAGGIKAAHQAAVNTKWEALCGLRLNQISRER